VTVTAADLQALLPQIALGAAAVAVLTAIAIRRHHLTTLMLTVAGWGTAFGALFAAYGSGSSQVTELLVVNLHTLFYTGLLILAGLAVTLLSAPYIEGRALPVEEYYLLVLLATLGACVLVAADHFVSLFLGLETLSVSLYALIAYLRGGKPAIEAGIKYLILAAVSSAILLFGMALIYARLGIMSITALAATPVAQAAGGTGADPAFLAGLGLLFVGVGFKLAVVPFHMWTPDVYEGAPAPIAAFVATVSKGAMLALIVRFAAAINLYEQGSLLWLISLSAVASMLVGNLVALRQENVKRMLAYSSIAHLGYLLVALLAGGERGAESVAFYLVAYFVTTLGAFGVIAVLSTTTREFEMLEDFRGLGRRHPWMAGVLTVMLFSLGGIPLTAGFVGKYLVLATGVESALWWPVVILILGSVVGIVYYLRVIVAMWVWVIESGTKPPTSDPSAPVAPIRPADSERSEPTAGVLGSLARLMLAVLTLALLGLGIWPGALMRLIAATV